MNSLVQKNNLNYFSKIGMINTAIKKPYGFQLQKMIRCSPNIIYSIFHILYFYIIIPMKEQNNFCYLIKYSDQKHESRVILRQMQVVQSIIEANGRTEGQYYG